MQKIARSFILTFSFVFFLSQSAFAAWVWSPEAGKFVNPDEEVQGTPQEQFDHAMSFYKKGDLKETADQLRLLLKRYPGAQVAAEGQYRLGTVYEELGDYYRAFRAYRSLLERYPSTEHLNEAVERQFRIGNLFLSGRKAKLMGLSILPSGPRAVEVFKHIVEAAPFSEYGDRAQFHLGLAHKKMNRFDESIEAFQGLIDKYPQSKLVPQARFQIADTSYLQSVAATRDQRVMDRAAKELDRFLKHHPDSSVSDKAARLRQEIDEKNSEKNYRVGLFYEKENFLDSAFIYYRDVAARYPHTLWGTKAAERLQALEKPVEFVRSQEAQVKSEKEKTLKALEAVPAEDPAARQELEWKLKRLEEEEKDVEKSKSGNLKRRRLALLQKEKELSEKWKNLKKKKKRFSKNPSSDLVVAFERWEASLEREKSDLVREKFQLGEWEKNLGVKTAPFYSNLVPFMKDAPTPVEQVRQVEVERFVKLAKERVHLLQEKENLYREYEKVMIEEGASAPNLPAAPSDRKLADQEREIGHLQKTLEEKESLYEKYFGTSPWTAVWRVPTKVVTRSVGILNPFDGREKDWESKSKEELKALSDQWQEKIAAQKNLVDTIGRAFDDELARAEEKRLLGSVEVKVGDPHAMRRAIKQMEREIRSRYNEIQDRNARKNELLESIEENLKGREKGGAGRVTAPVTGFFKLGKAFIFGLPDRDVELTRQAGEIAGSSGEIAELKKEVELESLMIQARNEEIQNLTRELEALRARASLSEAPAFRSLLIKFPYVFIREAIVSAGRLVPREDREEKLIEQLNRETAKLETLKAEQEQIQSWLAKGGRAAKREPKKEPKREIKKETVRPPVALKAPDQAALRSEIQSLQKQLEIVGKNYEAELERSEKTRWLKLAENREGIRPEKVGKIEEELVELIEKEQKIHEEEGQLLTKKKEVVEQFLGQPAADIFVTELGFEKKEIESRLNEIQKRQTTLVEELRRLRPQSFPPAG